MNPKILTLSVLIIAVLVSSGCISQFNENEYTCCMKWCENESIEKSSVFSKLNITCEMYCERAGELFDDFFFDEANNTCLDTKEIMEKQTPGAYEKIKEQAEEAARKAAEKAEENIRELQFCRQAQALIQRAKYDSESNKLTLSLFNVGEVPLAGFKVELEYEDNSTESLEFEDFEVQPDDIKDITVSLKNTLKQAKIVSFECRGVHDLVGSSDIQGMVFKTTEPLKGEEQTSDSSCDDCKVVLTYSANQNVRVNDDESEEFYKFKYVHYYSEGDYYFDESFTNTNLASYKTVIVNEGDIEAKNIETSYQCIGLPEGGGQDVNLTESMSYDMTVVRDAVLNGPSDKATKIVSISPLGGVLVEFYIPTYVLDNKRYSLDCSFTFESSETPVSLTINIAKNYHVSGAQT